MLEKYLLELSLIIIPVLVAVTFHEVAHGYVAYLCGDNTAKLQGRLTLNPIKHLDLVGSIVFILTRMIGWAKPVPIDPRNFKNPKRDLFLVSFAGPATNIILAVCFAIIFKAILLIPVESKFIAYKILMPLALICKIGVQINIAFALFNLLPIPPLDGSKIVYSLLPEKLAIKYSYIEPFGFIIILILVFTNILNYTLFPLINILVKILI